MKHLQLNTSTLRNPTGVMKFILDNNIDVTCLQEICYPTGGENPLERLAKQNNYYYAEGVHFFHQDSGKTIATAILSKFPILDTVRIYFNSENLEPKEISETTNLGAKLLNDTKQDNFPGSRGIKHAIKSRCILACLLQTNTTLLRTISTQFTVTDHCTETEQMFHQATSVYSLVKYSSDIPTIFAGDLNIRPKSYSVQKLETLLTCHTKDLVDTLAKDHIAKQKDFPEGLAVDHVFSKNLSHVSTTSTDAGLSDHQAIISEFS